MVGIGGEASRSEAFEYLIVVVCVNCVLHRPACLCVAQCPQLPRDNIQFVRKPTDFESARSSTPPLLRSIHEFFRLLSFLPSTICPSASPLFNFVPYILLSYTRRCLLFVFLWETVQLLCTGASALLISLFCHFLLFQYFGRSILTLPWFRWIYSWNMKLYRYAWYIYCIYYSCAPFFPLFFFQVNQLYASHFNWPVIKAICLFRSKQSTYINTFNSNYYVLSFFLFNIRRLTLQSIEFWIEFRKLAFNHIIIFSYNTF